MAQGCLIATGKSVITCSSDGKNKDINIYIMIFALSYHMDSDFIIRRVLENKASRQRIVHVGLLCKAGDYVIIKKLNVEAAEPTTKKETAATTLYNEQS